MYKEEQIFMSNEINFYLFLVQLNILLADTLKGGHLWWVDEFAFSDLVKASSEGEHLY